MDKIIEKSGLGEGHSGFLPDGARCLCTSLCNACVSAWRAWPCAYMHGMALAGRKQGCGYATGTCDKVQSSIWSLRAMPFCTSES